MGGNTTRDNLADFGGPMLTIPDVAAHFQVHKETVRRMIRSGALPARKIGRQYRILRSDLDAYIERS